MCYKKEWLHALAAYLVTAANVAVLLGALVGGGAAYIKAGGFDWGGPHLVVGVVGAFLGGLAGFLITWLWRVQAHLVLCFAQIEQNTRLCRPDEQPSGRAPLACPRD